MSPRSRRCDKRTVRSNSLRRCQRRHLCCFWHHLLVSSFCRLSGWNLDHDISQQSVQTPVVSAYTCIYICRYMPFNGNHWVQGIKSVAQAAAANQRVVLVSSALVTPKNRFSPIRIILNNIRWSLMDNKFKGAVACNAFKQTALLTCFLPTLHKHWVFCCL